MLAGVFVLLKAVAYYFDRYELLFSDRRQDIFYGATYTDLNAVMPAKLILLFISIICAAAFFAAVFRRNLQLPAIAIVLLILSSVLIGAAWPAVLQQFVVAPNANEREAPCRSSATSTPPAQAFGMTPTRSHIKPYSGTSDGVAAGGGQRQGDTMPNIRLLDPVKIGDTFTQLQQRRTFYGFPSRSWTSTATRPTRHDAGLHRRRARAQQRRAGQQPDRTGSTGTSSTRTATGSSWPRPTRSTRSWRTPAAARAACRKFTSIDTGNAASRVPEGLRVNEPRIYYGELITDYSIVGGQSGATPREYDSDIAELHLHRHRRRAARQPVQPAGVRAGYHGERNILFNSSINADSKIMYVRKPDDRVQAVAPWLTTDSDPYPAVVDGRLTWIVDGYTTLPNYPYAEEWRSASATTDAQSSRGSRGRTRASATCATR